MNTHVDATGDGAPEGQDIGYLLTAHADGELSAEGRQWVEAQLAGNAALRARHERIRSIQEALRRHLPTQPAPLALDAQRQERLLASLRRRPHRGRMPRRFRPLVLSFMAASLMAAVVVLGMSMTVFSHHEEREEELAPMKLTVLEPGTHTDGYAPTLKDLRSRTAPLVAAERDLEKSVGAVDERASATTGLAINGLMSQDLPAAAPAPAPPPAGFAGGVVVAGTTKGLEQRQDAEKDGGSGNRAGEGIVAWRRFARPQPDRGGAVDASTFAYATDAPAIVTAKTETLERALKSAGENKPDVFPVTIATSEEPLQPRGREEAVSTSEMGGTGAFMSIGAGGDKGAPVARRRAGAKEKETKKPEERKQGWDEEHKLLSENVRAAMLPPQEILKTTSERSRRDDGYVLDAKGPERKPGLSIGAPGTDGAARRAWHAPDLAAIDAATYLARLQAPLVQGQELTHASPAYGLDRVIGLTQLPVQADEEVTQHLLQRQHGVDHALAGGALTNAQGLLQVARSLDLQVLPGAGSLELQPARAPLDPGTTVGLDPDTFRAAFGTEPMRAVKERPQITTALDGDTASYALAKARIAQGRPVDGATVRPEHFINAMPNDYPAARGPEAFALYAEAAPSPFPVAYPAARGGTPLIVAVGVVGRAAADDERRPLRLTLAVDASGSMAQAGGLDRVRRGLGRMIGRLGAEDRVSVVAFADAARVVLPATPGNQASRIIGALDALVPDGSTDAVDGLMLAYQMAAEQVRPGVENRVVFISDGAALTGDRAALAIERAKQWRGRGISLLVLGCGDQRGDPTALGALADRCDGQHVQLASDEEADQVFATTLLPSRLGVLARDAKLQVTWNPERVAWARLIGYDQRRIADKDFRNDSVDAGELNHETRLTALYEVIPADGAAGPLGEAAVRYFDTRLERVRELACPMPGSVLAARPNDRLRLLACAAETAEWLQRGWWSNVRLPRPERIRAVLATCPQPEARDLEALLGPAAP